MLVENTTICEIETLMHHLKETLLLMPIQKPKPKYLQHKKKTISDNNYRDNQIFLTAASYLLVLNEGPFIFYYSTISMSHSADENFMLLFS